jgi:hypothetical protein
VEGIGFYQVALSTFLALDRHGAVVGVDHVERATAFSAAAIVRVHTHGDLLSYR